MQKEKRVIEQSLADPDLYNEHNKELLKKQLREQAELVKRLEATELRWLQLHEALEELDAQDTV